MEKKKNTQSQQLETKDLNQEAPDDGVLCGWYKTRSVQGVYSQRGQDACNTIIAEQKRDRSTAEELGSYRTVRKHQKDL